jgi:hypothetical protein
MDLSVFERMDSSQLRSYLEFLLWHYRVMDGFWFLSVSDEFDQQTAEKINRRVWGKIPELAAMNLVKRFQIEEKGLKGFITALKYFPWTILIEFDIDEKEDEVFITVPSCPPQVARRRHGLPEFDCKEMHRGEFESFAHVIDDRINVECFFAPPDPHPDDCFCKWRFTLKGSGLQS